MCAICVEMNTSNDFILFVAQALERMMSPTGPSPNPNVPSEYCSTIPPLQQARAAGTLNSPPPTVMVPVSVLKHPNNDSMISLMCCTVSNLLSAVFLCTLEKFTFPCCQVVRVNRSACGLLTASYPMARWQTQPSCQ